MPWFRFINLMEIISDTSNVFVLCVLMLGQMCLQCHYMRPRLGMNRSFLHCNVDLLQQLFCDWLLQKLNKSSSLVTANYGRLKVESDRLETHVKRACGSWILVMIVIVILTFIWMVLFMKMFPKKWLSELIIYWKPVFIYVNYLCLTSLGKNKWCCWNIDLKIGILPFVCICCLLHI